jgi:hypothetical protein
VSGPELPEPPPLVEVVLVAGSGVVTARVRSTAAADRDPTPLGPDQVTLWLEAGDGASARFDRIPDSAGYYRAALPVTAGARYELRGVVGGVPTRGTTIVPGPLVLLEPPADTIPLPLGRIARLRIRWQAAGASRLLATDGYFVAAEGLGAVTATRDSIVDFVVAPPEQPGDVAVDWWAENADLDRYLSGGGPPRSNLEGAFGVLGGASRARRILRWR